MDQVHPGSRPPARVLEAFEADGPPTPLAGGRGLSWRAGGIVLKPAEADEQSLAWQAAALARSGSGELRVALPRRSARGRFVVDGWMASAFCEGTHRAGRWLDVIAVGERFHALLAHLDRPEFLDGRRDRWAVADRAAWGEVPLAPFLGDPHVAELAALLAPVDLPSQVIHGDLTGNVLFADDLPPAVIDVAPYWRPTGYASAVVVADALAWEGASARDLVAATAVPAFGQLLARALLFRMVTDQLADAASVATRAPAHASAVRLARRLIEGHAAT